MARIILSEDVIFETFFGQPTGKIEGLGIRVTIINTSNDDFQFYEPSFKLSVPFNGNGDAFCMTKAINSITFPKTIKSGEEIVVAYRITQGMIEMFESIVTANPNATIKAIASDSSGGISESNLYKVADIIENVNYEHDFVYEKELPCFLLFDRAVLNDILPKGKMKDIDGVEWIGEDFVGEFDYYAVFDCGYEGQGPSVFTAYLGINEETAKKISEYIHPGGTPILYFYSPFIAVVNKVYHKSSIVNKQYKVMGELLYFFKDDYTESDMIKKYQNEE